MMLYLRIFKLQPMYGQLIKSVKSKVSVFYQNVKSNSNLASQTSRTESINVKASQDKDKLLFYYENPRYFNILNAFAFVQFCFWVHMAEFTYNKGDKLKIETNEYTPWWRKLNFEDKNTRRVVAGGLFLIGYGVLSISWIYTLRAVRMLVLRKDKKTISIVTYGPFNRDRVLDVPLENNHSKPIKQVHHCISGTVK